MGSLCIGRTGYEVNDVEVLQNRITKLELDLKIEQHARRKAQAKLRQIQAFFIQSDAKHEVAQDILDYVPDSPRKPH